MNLASELVCECGKRFDPFSFLVKLGFEREALVVDFKSFEPDVAAIIPRLACKNCGKWGGVTIYTKPLPKPQSHVKKVPFSQQLVGTDRGVNRIFHRQRCGYAQKIRREDEVFFQTREDAVRRGYAPCKSCRP